MVRSQQESLYIPESLLKAWGFPSILICRNCRTYLGHMLVAALGTAVAFGAILVLLATAWMQFAGVNWIPDYLSNIRFAAARNTVDGFQFRKPYSFHADQSASSLLFVYAQREVCQPAGILDRYCSNPGVGHSCSQREITKFRMVKSRNHCSHQTVASLSPVLRCIRSRDSALLVPDSAGERKSLRKHNLAPDGAVSCARRRPSYSKWFKRVAFREPGQGRGGGIAY